jgi:hypothetical protein
MRRATVAAACGLMILALSYCAGERQGSPRASRRVSVLPLVPKIPGSAVLDTTGGEDVERMQLSVPLSADEVASFYRSQLPEDGWRVRSDRSDAAGVDIYAVRDGPHRDGPQLWVHIERGGAAATRYALIAALAPGSDTTATREGTKR